jgi:hypothetical protein
VSRLTPWRARICPCRRGRQLNQIKATCRPASLIRAPLRNSCILGEKKLAHKTIIERFVAVVRSKNASPTWRDVRTALLDFDCAALRRLVQDLYTASKIPLIEPDMQISRIRLSDKTSRLHPRHVVPKPA